MRLGRACGESRGGLWRACGEGQRRGVDAAAGGCGRTIFCEVTRPRRATHERRHRSGDSTRAPASARRQRSATFSLVAAFISFDLPRSLRNCVAEVLRVLGAVEHRGHLEIETEAPVVDVRRAHRREEIVHHERLRVDHRREVFVDPHARREERVVVGARRRGHDQRVAPAWHEDAHVDPAHRRRRQRCEHRVVGHEVRRRHVDALAGRRDGCKVQLLDRLDVAVRTRCHDLHEVLARPRLRREVDPVAGRVLRHVVPVVEERELEPAHGVARDLHVGVAPRPLVALHLVPHVVEHLAHLPRALDRQQVVVREVHAAGEPDDAVTHHDLPMVAEVDAAPDARERHLVEARDLDAGLAHRLREAAPHRARADVVYEQAHRDAGLRALDQRRRGSARRPRPGSKM